MSVLQGSGAILGHLGAPHAVLRDLPYPLAFLADGKLYVEATVYAVHAATNSLWVL